MGMILKNMSKLTVMCGLPASGKSTRSMEIMRERGNTVRINKDLLRKMLHFDTFSGRNESLTRDAARALARAFLQDGVNVIIDDTNLNPRTFQSWTDLAKELGVKTEVIDLTDVPVEKCVQRDAERSDSVGGTVIKNMALRYGLQPIPDKGFVVVDLDGTIADCEHRRHFVAQTPKDWRGFFAHMSEDPLRVEVASMVIDYYNRMHQIIYVSARPEDYRDVTLQWLKDKNMSFGWTLLMRKSGDKRPDVEVKQEIYDTYLKRYPIEVVIDDRPQVLSEVWIPALGKDRVIDVGNNRSFIEERKRLDYWTTEL